MGFKFDTKEFSKRVKYKRLIDRSIDLRKAAKEAGVDHTAVHRAEHGKEPSLLNFYALCRWIGADMRDFFKKDK